MTFYCGRFPRAYTKYLLSRGTGEKQTITCLIARDTGFIHP